LFLRRRRAREAAVTASSRLPRGDRLLDAGEVAELLYVPLRWVREQTRAGKLPCVSLRRYRRYDRADVLAWVEAQKSGGIAMTFRKHVPVPDGGTNRPQTRLGNG
jgi:excisionase family DNA binding protein